MSVMVRYGINKTADKTYIGRDVTYRVGDAGELVVFRAGTDEVLVTFASGYWRLALEDVK